MQSKQDELRTAQTVRKGLQLERTMGSLRWKFKRASNWERDQSISGLQQINGLPFRTGNTVANYFASEWRPVLSTTHHTVPASALHHALKDHITVPAERILFASDNALLLVETTLGEVPVVITALNRHKAAGQTG